MGGNSLRKNINLLAIAAAVMSCLLVFEVSGPLLLNCANLALLQHMAGTADTKRRGCIDLGSIESIIGLARSWGASSERVSLAMAHVHWQGKDLALVKEELSDLAVMRPKDLGILLWLAEAYEMTGDWVSADETYSQAAAIAPQTGGWLNAWHQANAYQQKENWELAVQEYRRAVALLAGQKQHFCRYLDRALVELYRQKVMDNPEDAESRYLFWRFLERVEGLESRVAKRERDILLQNPALLSSLSGDQCGQVLLSRARYMEYLGDIPSAIEGYEQALACPSKIPEVYARLLTLYQSYGYEDARAQLEQRLAGLSPDYLVTNGSVNNWRIVGFDVDEDILVTGASLPFCIYWTRDTPITTTAKYGQYILNDFLIECKDIVNLAPNAGFEWDNAEAIGFPVGYYPKDLYQAPETNHVVSTDDRDGQRTQVLILHNDLVNRRTGVFSYDIPVTPGASFLMGGRIRSEGGRAHLGVNWRDGNGGSLRYEYVARDVIPKEWRHYAGLLVAPPNVRKGNVVLINWESERRAFFDNILFVEVYGPDFAESLE